MRGRYWLCLGIVISLVVPSASWGGSNLLADPSFEVTKERDRFGLVFAKWGGWKYDGDCSFAVGRAARTGKHSCLLIGGAGAKIRAAQLVSLQPGRYRITAYIRGLDIGKGSWGQTTEFMFADKYIQLNKSGTFGWTRLTYVGDIPKAGKFGPSFGMMAPGYFWIDDVLMEKVRSDVPLTKSPVLGKESQPIAPPGKIGTGAVRCAECGYRNMPKWRSCYACATPLTLKKQTLTGPPVKLITSFEGKNPFAPGAVVSTHATHGSKSLRIDRSYSSMNRSQDWTGYDYLKADIYSDAKIPTKLYVEIRDSATAGYWTRVNYNTIVPPGRSRFVLPIKRLFVGEKSRPGRMLILSGIRRLVFNIGSKPPAPLFVDNIRLERDDSARKVLFDGLHAFDFGKSSGPVLEGFTQITPSTRYTTGRGYGLRGAKIWRTYDVLQPDPLYQDFICIESGGLAVDAPNGKYRVVVNYDNPSGFWGEYQVYRKRSILAEGKPVVTDTMDFASFKKKYYRFWNVEDLPADDTFDKYQKAYYREKTFTVDVTDGRLDIDFQGSNWACSVSSVIAYPVAKSDSGKRFVKYVEDKRRFHFNNYFKRVLHRPTGDRLVPSAADKSRGYVTFVRDCMKDVYYNDTPLTAELGKPITGRAFAGEYEPLTFSILPLRDLGEVTVSVGDLSGSGAAIPSRAIDVAHVSYRLSRITMEGSVYAIKPRLLMPSGSVEMPARLTRRFWLTVRVPAGTPAGVYKGNVSIKPARGRAFAAPIEFTVCKGSLDAVDIPAGPWSHTIRTPWYGADPAARAHNELMARKSLARMRDYGFTSFSGLPVVTYKGFKDGKPVLDFSVGDAQMKMARQAGFTMPVVTYCPFGGLNLYYQSLDQMKKAGFSDYSSFVRSIFSAVQTHAESNNWLDVYWNLGDEPIGDDLTRSIENAEAYKKAFPKGPPYFTAASSFRGNKPADPHFVLSKNLHIANWNTHDEDSVNLIRSSGGRWAFYNGGNRWTYGVYMYKAAKQFDMKFRLSWHWNCAAGDPYYALDCREDDYAWCNSSPEGRLIPAVRFERLREGLDDYRRMLTLARLVAEKPNLTAAKSAKNLIAQTLGSFKLGQRNHDALFGPDHWTTLRRRLDDAIEAIRK
ncbi:MAG: hypothetical protein QGG42_09875 [Phycisphaerae bacterium]|nr:hypothetical protein [Phycisphaerae bacterium]